MLKKLEIAHMLDAYEEEEFVPEEENLVDPQRVRAAVMGRVRRGRTRRVLLTAAVLAACLGLVGWTYGERVYQFMCGRPVGLWRASDFSGVGQRGQSPGPVRGGWTRVVCRRRPAAGHYRPDR